MTADIFGRLAARTLGRSDLLVPLAPSRFEPSGEPAVRGPDLEIEPDRSRRQFDPALRLPDAERSATDPREDPASEAASPGRIVIESLVITTNLARAAAPDALANPPDPATGKASVGERLRSPGSQADVSPPALSPRQGRAVFERKPMVSAVADTEPFASGARAPSLSGSLVRTAAERRAAGLHEARAEPPTIVVRIGRVDIHAVSPTKPAVTAAATPTRPSTRPSLADHLRARAEGRR